MSIELPPLPLQLVRDERHLIHEARERILLARIAELETDAERYRWLRNESGNDYEASTCTPYARCDSGPWKDYWLTGKNLDEAIDAARKA